MNMKKKEIKHAIKVVYGELWELLSLYEKTGCFNKVPEGEAEEEIWDYMERKVADIRKTVAVLFLGEAEIAKDLNRIIDETEYFVKQYEVPGVVNRWKQVNPKLIYFDAAFTIMEEEPELYKQVSRGLKDVHFACYPDAELIAERNKYFKEIKRKNQRDNLKYSEDRIFQNELLCTLTLLFEELSAKYL